MKQTPERSISTSQMMIIAAALHLSIFIHIFIIFYLARAAEGWVTGWFLKEGGHIFLIIFSMASLVTGSLSLFFPKIVKVGPKAIPTMLHEVEVTPLFFDFSNVTPMIYTQTIVRMALAESFSIFGFVLSILNNATHWILPFAAAGLLLQILVGPFGRFLRGN